jgi:hypothetical protein
LAAIMKSSVGARLFLSTAVAGPPGKDGPRSALEVEAPSSMPGALQPLR